MKIILVDILLFAAVVKFEYISAVPSYGSQSFLGYNYWNTRYRMNYDKHWLGYWNNYIDGRNEYKRKTAGNTRTCPCDSCSNYELQCSTFTGTSLYVYIYAFYSFINNYLSLFKS